MVHSCPISAESSCKRYTRTWYIYYYPSYINLGKIWDTHKHILPFGQQDFHHPSRPEHEAPVRLYDYQRMTVAYHTPDILASRFGHS
jgi:hypothetical protein